MRDELVDIIIDGRDNNVPSSDILDAILARLKQPSEEMIEAYFDKQRESGFHAGINATAAITAMIETLEAEQ